MSKCGSLTIKSGYVLDCRTKPHDWLITRSNNLFIAIIHAMDAPDNLHQVTSSEHLKELLSKDLNRVSLLYFWAPWAEPCKQMTKVITELTRKYPEVLSLQIEAEEQSEIAESFDIGSVPLVLLLRVRRLLLPSPLPSEANFFLTQGPHTSHPYRGCRRRRPHRRPYEPCETCRGAAFPN